MNELESLLDSSNEKHDVIVLTEVNIQQKEHCPNLQGYTSFANLRVNRKGGGIIIWVKDNLAVEELDIYMREAEIMGIRILKEKLTYLIYAIYRPPNSKVNEFINELNNLLKDNSCKNEG